MERRAREEASAFGLFDDHDARRFDAGSSIAKYVFPSADEERLLACCQWVNTLFYLDDQFDENKDFVADEGRVLDTMEAYVDLLATGAPMRGFPAFSGLALALRARLLELGSQAWFESLCCSTREYLFDGVLRSARAWKAGGRLRLDDYMRTRELDSGVYTCIDLVEIAANIDLPEHVRSSVEVRMLRRLCARHVALVNDVVSYDKEVPRHDNPQNVICIRMEEGVPFTEAVAVTMDVINGDMRTFSELSLRVVGRDPAVRAYVDGMYHWMRGNVDWSLCTQRYATLDNPFPELRLGAT